MNASELKHILQLIIQSPVEDFHLEAGNVKVSLKKPGTGNSSFPGSETPNLSLADDGMGTETEATGSGQQPDKGLEWGGLPVSASAASHSEVEEKDIQDIVSPMVGLFYTSEKPDEPPFVKVGDVVAEDTVIGVVEMMKLFNEIQAGIAGEIVEILVENGQLVEYDQPLFRVKKQEASRYV